MTLAEKFDATLAKWIQDAIKGSDIRWCIALVAAEDVPDAIADGTYRKILVAKSAVDGLSGGMTVNDITRKQESLLDEVISSLKNMEARLDNERRDGQFLHRSMERRS